MAEKSSIVNFKNIGILTDCYPYADKVGDLYVGAAVELMKDIFDTLPAYDYKIVEFSSNYEKLLEDLSSGKIDMITGCCPTSYELAKKYPKILFSRPYYISVIKAYSRKKMTTNKFFRLFVIFLIIWLVVSIYTSMVNNKHILESMYDNFKNLVWVSEIVPAQGIVNRSINLIWLAFTYLLGIILIIYVVEWFRVPEKLPLDELKGQRLGLLQGFQTYNEYLLKLGSTPVYYEDVEQLFDAFKSGKIDYMIQDGNIAQQFFNKNPSIDYSESETITSEEYVFVFRKDEEEFKNAFNDKILYAQDKGFARHICEKYLGANYGVFCEL